MKNYLIAILVIFSSYRLIAQENHTIQKDPKHGNDMMVGEVSKASLSNLSTWSNEEYNFNKEYSNYIPDSLSVEYLKNHKSDLPYIFVVLGTWCGDSKDHVPHFLKAMDLAGYPQEKIFMVAVDRDKKGGDFCLADFNIELVPTFILTSKGNEIGRIIESPIISIEQDIVNIISKQE